MATINEGPLQEALNKLRDSFNWMGEEYIMGINGVFHKMEEEWRSENSVEFASVLKQSVDGFIRSASESYQSVIDVAFSTAIDIKAAGGGALNVTKPSVDSTKQVKEAPTETSWADGTTGMKNEETFPGILSDDFERLSTSVKDNVKKLESFGTELGDIVQDERGVIKEKAEEVMAALTSQADTILSALNESVLNYSKGQGLEYQRSVEKAAGKFTIN